MNAQGTILVGVQQGEVWVRVDGRGTFANSTGLRQFAKEMTKRGHRQFHVDLSCCSLMDSTFMGTLAGIALHLRDEGGGIVYIHHANERNHDLLRGLGLDHILTLTDACVNPSFTDQTSAPCASKEDPAVTQARTVLEAHEALIKADPENIAKFKDVLDYLRQDLGESQKSQS